MSLELENYSWQIIAARLLLASTKILLIFQQKNEPNTQDPSGRKVVAARRSMLLSCPFDQYSSGGKRRGYERPRAKPVNIPTVPGSKQIRLKEYGSSSCILETSNADTGLSGSDGSILLISRISRPI